MAKIRRAGFGTVFNIENEKVGIGTTGKFFTEVRVLKNLELSDANAVTQAKLENYQGFLSNETRLSGNDVDLNKLVGYVRGEAYYGESHAHTQDDGTVVNMVGSAHTTFSHNVIDDSSNIQSGAMGDIIIDGEFTVSSGTTYCSSVDQLTSVANFTVPTGNTDDRIHCHTAGSMRFNEDLGTLEFYTGDEWKTVNSYVDTGNRGRGVFAAGVSGPAEVRDIDFINIASQGNAISFGEAFPQVESRVTGTGNEVRGIFAGTNDTDSHEIIEYVTTASQGDSIDFGNLSEGRGTMGAAASSTRGIFMAGREPGVRNTIDYIEIMTTGNAIDFGDCTEQASWVSCNNSTTRAIRMGGENSVSPNVQGGRLDTIDFVTISSKGNAIDFGNMTLKRGETASCSNTTRGITAGGAPGNFKTIDFITMASQGNAIVFGDLTGRTTSIAAGVSNGTRGVIAGGYNGSTSTNSIDFILFSTTGNAQDFGDLTVDRWSLGGASDSHGGLGGF